MNGNDEQRRKRRRKTGYTVEFVGAMTDAMVGQRGNLSGNGMRLFATAPLAADALYQLRFNLSHSRDRAHAVEVGVHLLRQDGASVPGLTCLRQTCLDRQSGPSERPRWIHNRRIHPCEARGW